MESRMSADAKIWQEDDGSWSAIHDDQPSDAPALNVSAYDLGALIREVEEAMRKPNGMRWTLRVYPDGKAGLRGFTW